MKNSSSPIGKTRLFYGYVVVAAAFLAMAVSSGAVFSFSVFFASLQAEFGWTRAVTSTAFALHMIVQGLLAIGVGRLNDRFGPRIIVTVAGLLMGLGFVLVSRVQAVWQLYLLYGVLIGAGVSGGPVPLMSTVARWFRARRGLMTGIVMAGVGVGTMVVPPFADWLIRTLSWRSSYVIVGLLLLVAIPIAAQFLKRDPSLKGLQPLGSQHPGESGEASARALHELTLKEATHTKQLWLLVAAFAGFGFAVHSVMVHVVVHAIGLGLSSAGAAGLMTAAGALGVVGRVGIGSLADRHGAKRLMITQYAVLAVSLVWLANASDAWSIYACALLFGFSFGGIVPLNSHIVAELFGLRAHGAVLGATGLSVGIGSAVGPVFTGYCYDMLGSYTVPFLTCGGVAVAAGVLVCFIRPLEPKFAPAAD